MKNIMLITFLFVSPTSFAQDHDKAVKSFRETLAALVKADMTNPPGNESRGVEIIAARLKAEGIEYQTMEFAPGRSNLVARLKGSGEKKPLLLLAHLDVVGVKDQNWTTKPYEVTEKEGYLYGRGVGDDLGMGVINLETFIALKKQNLKLKRDVILAFTGDEESGGLGIQALLEKNPNWIDAEIAINEGGGIVTTDDGKVQFVSLNAAEKTYQDFKLYVKGTTGHSSVPKGDNAIYLMSSAIDRLSKYKPKERLLPAVREYFAKRAEFEKPDIAQAMKEIAAAKGPLPKKALKVLEQNPGLGPQMFTTCIPTLISGGSRVNSLPPDVTVNVNCRMMPDEPVANVQRRLQEILNDKRIKVTLDQPEVAGKPAPIAGAIPDAVRKIVKEMWPNVPVMSSMTAGATDSRFLRNRDVQAYGINPLMRTEADGGRAHGIDERIAVASIRPALEFQYRLVIELVK